MATTSLDKGETRRGNRDEHGRGNPACRKPPRQRGGDAHPQRHEFDHQPR